MANNFQIERSDDSGIRILALDGYLDAHTAPQFENAIHDEMQAGHQRIVVDCARLTYISFAAITPKVYQVFEVLGFPALFDILDSTKAAVAKFADHTTREA